MPRVNEQAHRMLDELAAEQFFGSLTFQFKAGKVSLIRKEETFTPFGLLNKHDYGRTEDKNERNNCR
jgi:hypothetical protein